MRDINKIILHCSATREGRDYSVATIRKWHTDKGWRDIGYHYVIQLDGTINTGRPVEMTGAHVRGHNKDSIGICYIGGVEAKRDPRGKWVAKDTRTEALAISIEKLILELMDKYPNATLHGHNEFSNKACPSFDVQVEYDYIINPTDEEVSERPQDRFLKDMFFGKINDNDIFKI